MSRKNALTIFQRLDTAEDWVREIEGVEVSAWIDSDGDLAISYDGNERWYTEKAERACMEKFLCDNGVPIKSQDYE